MSTENGKKKRKLPKVKGPFLDQKGPRRVAFLVEVPFYGGPNEAGMAAEMRDDKFEATDGRNTPHSTLLQTVRLRFGFETSVVLAYDSPDDHLQTIRERWKYHQAEMRKYEILLAHNNPEFIEPL